MFILVAYDVNRQVLEKRHYLTQPDTNVIKTFCKEVMSQYGTEVQVVSKELSYIEMGVLQ